jgi:hypothetical protein
VIGNEVVLEKVSDGIGRVRVVGICEFITPNENFQSVYIRHEFMHDEHNKAGMLHIVTAKYPVRRLYCTVR